MNRIVRRAQRGLLRLDPCVQGRRSRNHSGSVVHSASWRAGREEIAGDYGHQPSQAVAKLPGARRNQAARSGEFLQRSCSRSCSRSGRGVVEGTHYQCTEQEDWIMNNGKLWIIGGATLVAFATMGASCDTSTPGTAPTSDNSTIAPTTAPDNSTAAPTAPPTAPPAPATIFSLSGSGIKNTVDFTAPSEWTLSYTFNCSGAGGTGNFIVYTYSSDGTLDFTGPSVNELGASGASSTQAHNDGGRKYLSIDSECSWSVKVVG